MSEEQEDNGPQDERATIIMASEVRSDLRIKLSTSTCMCTVHPEKVCILCLTGPRQGQAEQLSKSRKKFHATTYKHFTGALYSILL